MTWALTVPHSVIVHMYRASIQYGPVTFVNLRLRLLLKIGNKGHVYDEGWEVSPWASLSTAI